MGSIFDFFGSQEDEVEIPDLEGMAIVCPECSKTSTLKEIHSDNDTIIIKCQKHGELPYDIKDYYKEIYKEIKGKQIINEEPINNLNFYYCKKCEIYLSEQDQEKHQKEHKESENEIVLKDSEDIKKFLNTNLVKVPKKVEDICKMIRFYQVVLNTFDNYSNNYFIAKSVINLADSITLEKDRKSEEIKDAMKELKRRSKNHKKALEEFNEKYRKKKEEENKKEKEKKDYKIKKDDERICLFPYEKDVKKQIRIGDDGFKLFSDILFDHLIELDVADNGITNVECLNNMILPHLKYLDMSFNDIVDIKPVADLCCIHLKEISLQNNKIETIEPFKDSYFPELELLRVEKNEKIKEKDYKGSEVMKKYKGKIIFNAKEPEEFDEEYGTAICTGLKSQNEIEAFRKAKKEQQKKDKQKNLKDSDNEKENPEGYPKGNPEGNPEGNLEGNIEGDPKEPVGKPKKIQIYVGEKKIEEKDIDQVTDIFLYEIKYKTITKIKDFFKFKCGVDYASQMLKDFYLTIPKRNKLEKLGIFNCEIKDPSLLTRIPLHNLKSLDLSLNKIKKLNFIYDMRVQKLKYLYLNHNNITDIKELLNDKKSFTIKVLSLNKNPLDYHKKREDIKKLSDKNVVIDILNGHYDEDEYGDTDRFLVLSNES